MAASRKLDLTQHISFMGLLLCKQELDRMKPGSILEVTLDNTVLAEDLIKIIDRSVDKIVDRLRDDELFTISILKGEKEGNE
jgi:TusA-related sulfurtransferase